MTTPAWCRKCTGPGSQPGPDLSSVKPPGRPAALQHRSWTQRGTLAGVWCSERCADGMQHTRRAHGASGEAGGAERDELPGKPLPQGSGGSH